MQATSMDVPQCSQGEADSEGGIKQARLSKREEQRSLGKGVIMIM